MLLVDVSTLFKFPSAFLIELIFSQMGWRDHHNLDLSRPRTESGGKLHPRASLVTIGSDVKWSRGIVCAIPSKGAIYNLFVRCNNDV